VVVENIAKKLVHDMHYEERVRLVVKYHADYLNQKISKQEARGKHLTRDEYFKASDDGCLLFPTLPQIRFLTKMHLFTYYR
jgi:hypothetical protein